MKKFPFFKMYPADADADENFRLMTFEQRGLYWTLLNHAWMNDGLPESVEDIRDLCRLTKEDFERMWSRVSKCFELIGGRLRNARQERERVEARSKRDKSADAARKMHERKCAPHADAEASAEVPLCERTADAPIRASESDYDSGFEVFSKSENQEAPKIEALRADAGDFEELLGMFVALGRGMTISDRIRCENEWAALSMAQQIHALRFARSQLPEWQTRPTSKIAQPWNYLHERHWERNAPRLLQQTRAPTRSEEAQMRAEKVFLGEA